MASPAGAKDRPLSFVVLGDRTGDAKPDVFRRILDEVRLLGPDLLTGTGDYVQGYTRDTVALNAQWDTIFGSLPTGIPYHFAPGNHDVTYPVAESVYTRRVGPLHHRLLVSGCLFLFVNSGSTAGDEPLAPAELRWLESELAAGRKARHKFVFMHRPFWRYAVDDTLGRLFEHYGVDCVFTGHDHFYCYEKRGRTRYFQVGPSGSRMKYYDERDAGGFQNYLFVHVGGDSVDVQVREPGKERPLPPDVVTLQSFRAFELAQDSAVTVELTAGVVRLTLRNVTPAPIAGQVTWADSGTRWLVMPHSIDYRLEPGGTTTPGFTAQARVVGTRLDSAPYPVPELAVPYDYLPGRTVELRRRPALLRQARFTRAKRAPRLDGVINDPCWSGPPALSGFGAKDGGRAPVEPVDIWLALSDSTLYLAARCRETGPGRIKAAVSERDGKVYEDDHLNFLLDPHPGDSVYYQLFVNSAAVVSDRGCEMQGSESRKSYSWNAGWRAAAHVDSAGWNVELSCPLADLGPSGADWGVNVTRFQSRLKDISVWQVPFEHDPATFGRVTPSVER